MKTQIACALVGWVTAIVMSSSEPARAETWTQKADMPTARMIVRTSVVDGKIYAISALQGSGRLKKVEAYDPATDTWAAKADLPRARTFVGVGVVDEKIYVIGGSTSWGGAQRATVEAYDPATDTWTRKADMPTARDVSACVVNGRIYAIGGYRNGVEVSTVEEYDPATDTWTKKTDMPTARDIVSLSAVNGKIYAIGGQTESRFPAFSTVEVYDPVTDTWTSRGDMPVPRTGFGTSVVAGKIYCFGGRAARGGAPLSTVFEYDPATDTWTARGNIPILNAGMAASTVGRRIYLIGGSSANYPFSAVLSTVYEFIPSPEFDFNNDGIVDAQDMSMMVDHWHTDASRYDRAPAPAGDGIVDVQDLIALSEHLFEDDRILAHWMLDETEGDVAYDSGATHDAVVIGNAFWQPEGGQVGGALQLDGIDDTINTPFILDPADAVFSVFAWVRGGGPGQVILSQVDGENWLMLDAQGSLKTTLKGSRRDPDLGSTVAITDDAWHRVGFTWDGVNRVLYVDDSEVARDTQTGLQGSQGDLYIGAESNLEPGTFWSGLIDDVLVYDRAVAP